MERNYIVISKEIAYKLIGNNKNRDAYVYAYLKLCSDFKTGISNVKERTLSELTGIPGRKHFRSHRKIERSRIVEGGGLFL